MYIMYLFYFIVLFEYIIIFMSIWFSIFTVIDNIPVA